MGNKHLFCAVGDLIVKGFGKNKVVTNLEPDTSYQTGEYPDNSPKLVTRLSPSRIFGGCWVDWELSIVDKPKSKKQSLSFENRRSFKDIKKIGNYQCNF